MGIRRIGAFLALAAFLFVFGLFYDSLEFRRGTYFDPFLGSAAYRELVRSSFEQLFAAGDLEAYHRAAYSLAEQGRFVLVDGSPSAWVVPGYPLVLAALFSTVGYHFFGVVALNALLLAGAYWLLISLARSIFSPRTALLCSVLLVLNLRAAMFVGYVYTECLFLFLLAASFACAFRIWKEGPRSAVLWCGLGAISGYALLTRPVFFGVLAVFAMGLGKWVRKRPAQYALFLIVSLLPLSAWVVRNHRVFGEPLVSTGSALPMADGNQDFYRQFRFWETSRYEFNASLLPEYTAARSAPGYPEFTFYRNLRQRFADWKAENPSFYRWLCAWRFKTMLSPYVADMSPRNRAISLALWLLTFPAAFAALWMERKSPWTWVLFAGAVIMLYLPALVIVGPSLRYQIPSQLLLTILSAAAYERFFRLSSKWAKSTVAE
jgi:4-amino-4-deoxy-L-arabinose transferase-like glycosyltransferase